jgi:D-alanyl-lipoteichoic acid acyltransferase DltB (MBOAT superfamily)
VERTRVWSWAAAEEATCLVAWGYFKKLVIADNVGVIANKVFSLSAPGFPVLWAGVFAFAIQIYADFSAYSDIGRGVARWLGFDLMKNFEHPYLATGPTDFWHRWHISLSTWFRDYVYIPLGGSRTTRGRATRNIMATFVLSGFWHGASWNYVIWGAYHGVLLVIGRAVGRPDIRHPAARVVVGALRVACTFALMLVGWLMFRETDIHMLIRDLSLSPVVSDAADRRIAASLFLLTAIYSAPIWIDSIWAVHIAPRLAAADGPRFTVLARTAFAGVAFALILVFRSRQSLDFIYFRF